MAVLKLLLKSSLIFITATTLCSAEILGSNTGINNDRLQDYIIPMHYEIKLTLRIDEKNAKNFSFHGEISVIIHVATLTKYLRLHKLNLEVTAIKLVKREKDSTLSPEYPLKELNYTEETQIFEIYFDKELTHGEYILGMSFHGTHNNSEESFFITSYVNETHTAWLIVTRFGARRVFPCWDEPALKTTFNISIKHRNKYQALSNTRIRNVDLDTKSFIWTHFHTTPKISTYQVAVVLFEFPKIFITERIDSRISNIRFRHRNMTSHLKLAQKIAESIMKKLVMDFRSMRQFPQVQQVAIPGFPNEGISNFGLIFYREESIIYDSELDSIGRQLEVASLVARQIAHQCFGNLVSPSWWSSWWLYDATAILFELNAIHQFFLEVDLTELFVVQHQHESLHLDSYFNISMIPSYYSFFDINSLFFSPGSYKAASILRMLYNIIDNSYQDSIRKYIDTHAYSSATSDDLWTIMQDIFNETQIVSNDSNIIIKLMNSWTKLKHYPVLNVKREAHYDNLHWINVSIENFDALGIDGNHLYIPVIITTQKQPNFYGNKYNYIDCSRKSCSHSFSVDYAPNDWILINMRQVGYYRVNYDPDIWQSIATFLNSSNYNQIHVLNCGQIIDDAFYFMMVGKLESTIFWNLASYLSRETNYVAWYPMFKALEYISRIFPFSDERIENLKVVILHTLRQLLNKIGYVEQFHDIQHDKPNIRLRQEAAKWACILGDLDCIRNATAKLSWHLENHKEHKLLPWWEKWTYCNGLKKKEISNITWDKVFKIWIAKPDINKMLHVSACSDFHTSIIEYFLHMPALQNFNGTIQINDRVNFVLAFTANIAKSADAVAHVLLNFKEVKNKYVNAFAALSIIISHARDRETLNTVEQYVGTDLSHLRYNYLYMLRTSFTEMVSTMINNVNEILLYTNYKTDMNLYGIAEYVKDETERLNLHVIKHKILSDTSEIINKIISIDIEQVKSNVQSKIEIRRSELEKHKQYVNIVSIP